MKKILISTVAAAITTTSLMAAAQNSNIYFGKDINGTVQSLTLTSATAAYTINGTSILDTTKRGLEGIKYVPEIGIGKGNLITIKINNGYVADVKDNELYLIDTNTTIGDTNVTGRTVVARMTDFVASADGNGYSEMTFKFDHDTGSTNELYLVNEADDSNVTGYEGGWNNVSTTNLLQVVANQGLVCGDKVQISVINSTDQSAAEFPVANAPIADHSMVSVFNALSIAQTLGGAAFTNSNSASRPVSGAANATTTTSCPTWSCTIALPNETSFGSNATTNITCPTCTPSTTPSLICGTRFDINYKSSTNTLNDTAVTSIDYTLTTTDTSAISSVIAYAGTANLSTAKTVTATNNIYSVSVGAPEGLALATAVANNTITNSIYTDMTVDGTTIIKPRTFDLDVKANTNISIDSITNFLSFTESGTQLSVSYLNANPDYRTFVRVTSSAAATIQAIVTTEDGATSSRVDITKADGTAVTIGANGGAVVVEAADLLRSAQDAGFTGAGNRFNAVLYVKTVGAVDAVAYQTANGSQRYLPVAGATGGGVN